MSEIAAIQALDSVLADLDEEERSRVLQWAIAKYGKLAIAAKPTSASLHSSGQLASSHGGTEIPGIAALTPNGEFKFTARDVKAKNTNDAAIRIAHIAIWAYQQLTNEATMPSKKVLVPILRTWRAYTGNTRYILAKHKGILREGDNLSLDSHSLNEAQKYVQETLDNSIEGTWQPRALVKKKRVTAVKK